MDEFGNVIRRATQAVSTLKVRLSMGMAVMQLGWLRTALSQAVACAGQPEEGGAESSCSAC